MNLPKLNPKFNIGKESLLYSEIVIPMALAAGVLLLRVENTIERGTPDCWVCDRWGNSYWIELKAANGKLSPYQIDFIREVHEHHGTIYVIHGGKSKDNIWQIIASAYRKDEMYSVQKLTMDKDHKFLNIFNYL